MTQPKQEKTFMPAGDCALFMKLGDTIAPEINSRIRSISYLLEKENIEGVIEWIPAYCTIMVVYNPLIISYHELVERLQELEQKGEEVAFPSPLIVEIPTTYGNECSEFGPDVEDVAEINGLTVEEVIEIHTGVDYLIYMIGFTPGFSFLGGLSEKIATPRVEQPRKRVPAGSVGIAGNQTGIYPIDSPGGWRLIGRTPLKLFDPEREEPILLKAGNYLRFTPITLERYYEIAEEIENNTYTVKKYPLIHEES